MSSDTPTQLLMISGWSETFENADTRKRERLKFFHAPSGLDSRGYISLVSRFPIEKAMAAFGVFQALCQLSATLGKSIRGTFKNTDGTPMDLQQISVILRIEKCQLAAAIEILTDERVRWLKWLPVADNLPVACQSHPGFVQGEGKGKGEDTLSPSIEECQAFAASRMPADPEFARSVAREFHGVFSVKGWATNQGQNLAANGAWKHRLGAMIEEKARDRIARRPTGSYRPSAPHKGAEAIPDIPT